MEGILRRTTFVVADAEKSARFYESVFGWMRFYDHRVAVHAGFPPAGPHNTPCHLVILKAEDAKVGMVGFMQYLEPPFDTAVPTNRSKVRLGETILVTQVTDIDRVEAAARTAGASICTPSTNWEVPSHDGKSVIRLRTMGMFDLNGVYVESNQFLA